MDATLAAILDLTRVDPADLEEWVAAGRLIPDNVEAGPEAWVWPVAELRVAVKMVRLYAAGLRPDAAERIARQPLGGAVVLGPQIVISIFPLRPAEAAGSKAVRAS